MRVVVHTTHVYEWLPLPGHLEPSPADKEAGLVKPDQAGTGWLMRVPIPSRGPTEMNLDEGTLVAEVFHKERRALRLSRKDAVKIWVDRMLHAHHAPEGTVQHVEVHDDGPDEALMREHLAPHVAAGRVTAAALEAHVAAYLAPATPDDHADHLRVHFCVPSKAVST